MKAFKFSLKRVQTYKGQILDKEKRTLGIFIRQRDEIIDKIRILEHFRDTKAAEAFEKQREGVGVQELLSFSYLIENARAQLKMARIELQRAEETVENQRRVVVAAYQEKTGMDRLEEKQEEEHRLLAAKFEENEVMQVISNKWADRTGAGDINPEIA